MRSDTSVWFLTISIHKALASLDNGLPILVVSHAEFQSTRLSRASTSFSRGRQPGWKNFNPQGSREPRRFSLKRISSICIFQSTRLSRASTAFPFPVVLCPSIFQSTRLSRASTYTHHPGGCPEQISIHKALASLDSLNGCHVLIVSDFNPQGSREPRPNTTAAGSQHRKNFNPQGSREPRPYYPAAD